MPTFLRASVVVTAVAVLAGCSSNPVSPFDSGSTAFDSAVFDVSVPTDTGTDAGTDGGTVTDRGQGTDTGMTTDVPVGTDTGVDARMAVDDPVGMDTGVDAGMAVDVAVGMDAGMDTGVDAGMAVDAGTAVDVAVVTDTGVDAGTGCDAAHVCATGRTCCAGQCRDLTTDPSNCGACGTVCGTGLCGTTLTAPMTTRPTAWTFNGAATWDGTAMSAVLTPVATGQTGTVWYQHPVVGDTFDAYFEFRIGGGTRADGMAFAIQTTGATAIGGGGGGFGVTGLNGYAVELDDFNNMTCGDANGNHTGVDTLTVCDSAVGVPTSLAASPDLYPTVGDIGDGTWRSCLVHVVTAGGVTQATVTVNTLPGTVGVGAAVSSVTLPGYVPGTAYTFGFGGATGGLTNRHEVRNVTVTFPTARCL